MVGYIEGKDALLNRLRRLEGQVRGIEVVPGFVDFEAAVPRLVPAMR